MGDPPTRFPSRRRLETGGNRTGLSCQVSWRPSGNQLVSFLSVRSGPFGFGPESVPPKPTSIVSAPLRHFDLREVSGWGSRGVGTGASRDLRVGPRQWFSTGVHRLSVRGTSASRVRAPSGTSHRRFSNLRLSRTKLRV